MRDRFNLYEDATDTQIGICILKQFAKDWRAVASHCVVPVSVHGTAISSMSPDRKKVWTKAYQAMKLKPATSTTLYAARMEPQAPKPQKEAEGNVPTLYLLPKKSNVSNPVVA